MECFLFIFYFIGKDNKDYIVTDISRIKNNNININNENSNIIEIIYKKKNFLRNKKTVYAIIKMKSS